MACTIAVVREGLQRSLVRIFQVLRVADGAFAAAAHGAQRGRIPRAPGALLNPPVHSTRRIAARLTSTGLLAVQAHAETRIFIKKLHVVRRRTQADVDTNTSSKEDPALLAQKRYRDDVPDLISQFREDAGRTRRIHHRFQGVIIIGSVVTSAIATASVAFSQARWLTVAASAAVGLSAGFAGYFKYHERSFNSQQTADAIEREYEAVELRVGKYLGLDEPKAYALFADTVETLRGEQNKRQQQLDQPAEVKREE